jgi:DNA sulfur modification protein DndB
MTYMSPISTPRDIDWEDTEAVGQQISGVVIDEHRFVAVMKFARLERLVENPLTASDAKVRDGSGRLADYYDLHQEIQRAFDTGKKANAHAYAQYIVNLKNGMNGDTPTIDLYTPSPLPISGTKNKLLWPYEVVMVPFDGETQLAARFIAAKLEPLTKDMAVVVTITHGLPVDYARQCFHDRNAYQRRAPVPVALAMDSRDPLIQVVRAIEERVPSAKGQILWRSRQMPQKGKDHIAAASFIRTAVACFGHGIGGVQMSKGELPEGLSPEDFTRRASIWFGRVIDKVGPYMRDREHFVASSPAVWAALGAMGKPLTDPKVTETATLESIADGLIGKLDGVNWSKGPQWIGIAIKSTGVEGGYSFAGGAKDTGSVAFKALSDSSEAVFGQIRLSPATPASVPAVAA